MLFESRTHSILFTKLCEIVRGIIDETDDKDNTKEEQVKALSGLSLTKKLFVTFESIALEFSEFNDTSNYYFII